MMATGQICITIIMCTPWKRLVEMQTNWTSTHRTIPLRSSITRESHWPSLSSANFLFVPTLTNVTLQNKRLTLNWWDVPTLNSLLYRSSTVVLYLEQNELYKNRLQMALFPTPASPSTTSLVLSGSAMICDAAGFVYFMSFPAAFMRRTENNASPSVEYTIRTTESWTTLIIYIFIFIFPIRHRHRNVRVCRLNENRV